MSRLGIDAVNAALRAFLDRGGRDLICEALLDGLTRESLVTGAAVRHPDGTSTVRGRSDGQRFELPHTGAVLSVAAYPPIDDDSGQQLAEVLDQLLLAQQQADESSRARTAEVRDLVHDIRSLLAVMLGHCEILESGLGGELNPRQRKSVASIKRQVERCEQLLTERRSRLVDPAP